MHFLGGLETPSGFSLNSGSGVENRNLKEGNRERSGNKKAYHEKTDHYL